MGTSGVLSQLFGGGASSGSGEKGWYHDTTANNPDGKGKRISLAKRLDLLRLAALSLTLVLAIQPAVSCGARSSSGAASQQQSTKPVTLEDLMSAPVPGTCKHDAGDLVSGQLPLQDPHYGFVAIAHKSATDDRPQVAFGDLTGDGVDDGAMVTACTAGGVDGRDRSALFGGPDALGRNRFG